MRFFKKNNGKKDLVPRNIWLSLIFIVALAPIAWMSFYVLSNGGNNFQDDYAFYIPHLTRIWNEGTSVDKIFDGSPHGPHFTAIPLFLRAAWMANGHWDAALEVSVSLILGVIRVGLVYQILANILPSVFARMTILVITSFMVFAPVQVGSFAYGDTGLTMGIDSLGFLIGLWGVSCFPRTWKGVMLLVVGGGVSAWAWGMAVTWMVLFVAALGYRFTREQLLMVILGGLCVHAPLFQYLEYFTAIASGDSGGGHDLFNIKLIVGALGRPFVSRVVDIGNYPLANFIGTAGLIFAVLATFFVARIIVRTKEISTWALPSLSMMAWSLLYLYQVSIARTTIGAWYVALGIYFWIGLMGLGLAIGNMTLKTGGRQFGINMSYGLILLASIFYVPANLSFDQKTPFFQSRTLSAEACQRHYLTAPTYCEMLLFFWPPTYEFARFSRFFDETALASFGKRQTWTLQGDYLFQSVWPEENPALPQIKWIKNFKHELRPLSWETHERLNLYLPSGQRIFWRVDLPANTEQATYTSKVHNRSAAALLFILRETSKESGEEYKREFLIRAGQTSDIQVDISRWKGKQLNLSFETFGIPLQAGLVLVYPRIDLEVKRSPLALLTSYDVKIQGKPENTELADKREIPDTPNDVTLEGLRQITWHGMYANLLTPEGGPACAGDYRALKIKLAVPIRIEIRMLRVLIATRAPNGNYFENEIQLPLLRDGEFHTYTVDLKLLPLDKSTRIEKIRLYSLLGDASPDVLNTLIELPEVRLTRGEVAQSFCGHSWGPAI